MPFVFLCKRCGTVLYRDSKPVLRDKSYRRETYLESIITKIGGKCPNCGRTLQVTPTRIEVSVPKQRSVSRGKGRTFSLVPAEPSLRVASDNLEQIRMSYPAYVLALQRMGEFAGRNDVRKERFFSAHLPRNVIGTQQNEFES